MLLGNRDEAKNMLKLARQQPSEMTAAHLDKLEEEIKSGRS
jgi:hypothetical protein